MRATAVPRDLSPRAAGGPLAWAGGDGSSRPYYPQRRFDFLNVPGSGSCDDPVGYAAWQLLLGALCNAI